MTFTTPLKKLDVFVPAILSANERLKRASVIIDHEVFEAKNLRALKSKHMLSEPLEFDTTLTVEGHDHVSELLKAALSDWVDFLFVPVLKLFVLYADHDQYSTFCANTKSNLERIRLSFLNKGFSEVRNYKRAF